MTDTVKHMWDQVEKARADGTFSSDHAAVPAQDAWWKVLADNWRGRNGNTTTGDSVRNSCADELEKVAARHTPAACEQPDIDTLAQFIRDAEREHGQCDDDDTYLSYRPTARAILQKFDVRPKHSSTSRADLTPNAPHVLQPNQKGTDQ